MKRKLITIGVVYYVLLIITACGKCENYDTAITDIMFLPVSTFILQDQVLEFDLITEEEIIAKSTTFDFKLIESAYAFGCDDTFNPIKWINGIDVTSNQDFSTEFQSGTSLNELINVTYFDGNEMTSINANLNTYIAFINQIGDGGKSNFNFETFTLNQRPQSNQQLSLRFEFTFTDGSTFILETEPIEWE